MSASLRETVREPGPLRWYWDTAERRNAYPQRCIEFDDMNRAGMSRERNDKGALPPRRAATSLPPPPSARSVGLRGSKYLFFGPAEGDWDAWDPRLVDTVSRHRIDIDARDFLARRRDRVIMAFIELALAEPPGRLVVQLAGKRGSLSLYCHRIIPREALEKLVGPLPPAKERVPHPLDGWAEEHWVRLDVETIVAAAREAEMRMIASAFIDLAVRGGRRRIAVVYPTHSPSGSFDLGADPPVTRAALERELAARAALSR